MNSTALSSSRRAGTTELPGEPPSELADNPWRVLGPTGMVEVLRPRVRELRRLTPGTTVCLVVDAPLSRWRLRRCARRAGLLVERELVAVPSTRAPVALVDDLEGPVNRFWASVATVPPGLARSALLAHLALVAARRAPWTWTGLLPGRVLIGRMP